jgi:hypothetical protein
MRETSLSAYGVIKSNGLLSERRFEVYDVLVRKGPMTANEVFVVLNEESKGSINAASNSAARFSELRDLGVIKECGVRTCKITGMNVIEWEAIDAIPKKFTAKERIQEQIRKAELRLSILKNKLLELE